MKKMTLHPFIATLKVEKVVIRGYVFNLITFFSKNQRLCLHLNIQNLKVHTGRNPATPSLVSHSPFDVSNMDTASAGM